MRPKKLSKAVLYAGITIFWLISMSLLFTRHYGSFASEDVEAVGKDAIASSLGEQWAGIYQGGSKIGYSMRRLAEAEAGYKSTEVLFMKIRVMGVEKDVKTTTESLLDEKLALKSFTFTLQSDIAMTVSGTVEGKSVLIKLDAGGLKSEQKIPLSERPYSGASVIPRMLGKGLLTKGSRMSIPVIEPSTLSEAKMEIEVMDKESLLVMGQKRDAFKLRAVFQGAEFFTWVTEKGEILKEEAMGFTFIKEAKDTAVRLERPSIDLIAYVSIPFNMPLPEDVKYLKARLSGINLADFELNSGCQKRTGDILEVASGAECGTIGTFLKEDYLKETIFIQSKDPEVVSLSKGITKGEKDAIKKAHLIYEWVYKNIEKAPTFTLPSAKEVLKSRRGDCNEHTTLYAALARASGIPTRIAVGVVYRKDFPGRPQSEMSTPAFYYHAWPEVAVPSAQGGIMWLPIDPTLGQFPADATHIRLITGDIDSQLKLVSVIGKLKIEGIEAR